MRHLEAFARRGCGITASRIRCGKAIHDRSRHESADEVAQTVGDEVDEALGRSADLLARPLVRVNLAGNKEKIVANAMEQDAEVE